MLKQIMIGLLRLSVVAIWAIEAQAATVCYCNNGKGCCVYRPGTVICDLAASGAQAGQFLVCNIGPPEGSPTGFLLAVCQNLGNNIAPGVQIFTGAFSGSATAATQVDNNGKATGTAVVSLLTNPTVRQAADEACQQQNANWTAANVAPCSSKNAAVLSETAEGTIVRDEKRFDCDLPVFECDETFSEHIGVNKKTGRIDGPNYVCTEEPQ